MHMAGTNKHGKHMDMDIWLHECMGLVLSLVDNMVKKNRSCFPIAVILTTLICSH